MKQDKPSLYELSEETIRVVESSIINRKKSKYKLVEKIYEYFNGINIIYNYLLAPFRFLLFGIAQIMKHFWIWVIILIAFHLFHDYILKDLGAYLFATFPPNLTPQHVNEILYTTYFFGSVFIVLFAIPSTYSGKHVQNDKIHNLANWLLDKGLNSTELVKLFQNNIEKNLMKINARVILLKWILRSSWAVFMFFFVLTINASLKSGVSSLELALSKNAYSASVMIVISILGLLIIYGYKKASISLIHTIEYACTELQMRLIQEKEKSEA